MIRKVHIQNFKSLADFEIELGRVNVIVGANGSGKTNIFEGIAMGAAAAAKKLDNEFLGARIRVTEPEYMRSGFEGMHNEKISIKFSFDRQSKFSPYAGDVQFGLISVSNGRRYWIDEDRKALEKKFKEILPKSSGDVEDFLRDAYTILDNGGLEHGDNSRLEIAAAAAESLYWSDREIQDFLIYSPENYFLRKFEEPSQIYPLGIRGEGLFHEIKRIFTDNTQKEQQAEILEHLQLFDWFEDMSIPNGLMSKEYKIAIKDRFLDPKLAAFDQRSANEGFLMLLFYLVLFTSDSTPKFFAIENIDSAFNPRLCWEIMSLLAQLSKKHDKQFIVTTHNASTLNGLDLKDDEQRLFVADRHDTKGHTRVRRIKEKPQSGILLSELWTKGYIGGMPENL